MIDLGSYVQFILENFSFKNWVQADRVLKKHYETVFSIHDHRVMAGKTPRPFAGQAALAGNTLDMEPFYRDIVEEYTESGFFEATKMSILEYLQLSREQRRLLVKICKTIRDQRQQTQEEETQRQQNQINAVLNAKTNPSPGARA